MFILKTDQQKKVNGNKKKLNYNKKLIDLDGRLCKHHGLSTRKKFNHLRYKVNAYESIHTILSQNRTREPPNPKDR